MPRIEGIRIRNFRALRDITLGQLWNARDAAPLTPLVAVIGKNGAGKSSVFDVFGFLADCLRYGVEDACDRNGRGGFASLRSSGIEEPIEFEVYYRQTPDARPITYELVIDEDAGGRPYVKSERLRQRRKGENWGRPFSFLILNEGAGRVWTGDELSTRDEFDFSGPAEQPNTEWIELSDTRRLGIATLGTLKQHPRISAFREFIEGWYLSYFSPDAARQRPQAGPQKRLNMHGDNLANVVQYMQRESPQTMKVVLSQIAKRIPGIRDIDTVKTADNYLLLRFTAEGFEEPFFAAQMSDGTLKVFTYLLLLHEPDGPPFICIEEPENGLYHKLLELLASEFREHANTRKNGAQLFLTTHQPYMLDALAPDEVWVLEKGSDGFSSVTRASDIEIVRNLVEEGLPLGGLWYSDYLDAR